MFKIETQNNFVTKINDISIIGEIEDSDYFTINRAILMSLVSLSLDKAPIKIKGDYSDSVSVFVKNFYISNGWEWYKFSKKNFIGNDITDEEFNLICKDTNIILHANILKQNCVLTKRLYHALINNPSINNIFDEYYQVKPILESKFSEFFKF